MRLAGAAAKDTEASSTPPGPLKRSCQAATAASIVGSFRLGLSGLIWAVWLPLWRPP